MDEDAEIVKNKKRDANPVPIGEVLSEKTETPNERKKNLKLIAVIFSVLLLIILASIGAYLIYQKYFSPLVYVSKGFNNLKNSSSFTANVEITSFTDIANIVATLDYQKQSSNLSRLQVKATSINKEPVNNFVLFLTYNKNEAYLQTSYSKFDALEKQLSTTLPDAVKLHSYQQIKPVLMGEKWLHINIPETNNLNKSNITKEKELTNKFFKSIIIKSYNINYKKNGVTYRRITLGFRKNGLISFLNSLKDSNLNINLNEINFLTKIIRSSQGWDKEIVEMLVNKQTGDIYSSTLSLPYIPKEALSSSLEEVLNIEQGNLTYLSDIFGSKVTDFFSQKSVGELNPIGSVTFTNYNRAPVGERPSPIIEAGEITNTFQNELPTLIQTLFTQTKS